MNQHQNDNKFDKRSTISSFMCGLCHCLCESEIQDGHHHRT